jgi:oligosaccharide repeat unit polymerase
MVRVTARPQSLKTLQSIIVLFVFFFVPFVLAGFLITNRIEYLLVGISFIPTVVLLVPTLLSKPYDLFHPLNFVALTTIIGITLRTIYIVTVNDFTTRSFLMLGKPLESMFVGLSYATLGVVFLVLGFSVGLPGFDINRVPILRNDTWSYRRLAIVLWVLAVVALFAIILYFDRIGLTPETLLSRISGKRRFVVEDAEYQYAALAYYLWGASLIDYVFLFLFTIQTALRKPVVSWLGFSTISVGMIACIFPIIVSSRSSIIVLLLTALMIWNYLRKVSLLQVISVLVVASFIITILGLIRNQQTQEVSSNTFSLETVSQTILPAVVGNRNFFGVDKTTHIIQVVPEKLRYQYGKTLILWALAPVPRTLWKDKPIISVGQIIGPIVFQHDLNVTGVPPGFVAELYWNGGIMAIVVGMFFLGVWLKFIYISFGKRASQNMNALLIYVFLVFPFSFLLLGGDFSRSMVDAIRSMVTLIVILILVSTRNRHTEHSGFSNK